MPALISGVNYRRRRPSVPFIIQHLSVKFGVAFELVILERRHVADIKFDEHEDDFWTCTSFQITPSMPNVRLTLTSDGEPTGDYISRAVAKLANVDELILKASELILENYSYEHFRKLGVEESLLLKEENAEAMSKVVVLQSAWFLDPSGDEYELSFSAPWDAYHSFDVEFAGDDASSCSVNG